MKYLILLFFTASLLACSDKSTVQIIQPPSEDNSTPLSPPINSEPSDSEVPRLEGVINGGGGKGILCEVNGVKKLEALDIYEGRNVYGLSYPQNLKSESEAMNYVYKKMALHYTDGSPISVQRIEKLAKEVKYVTDEGVSKTIFKQNGQKLKLTNDANDVLIEKGCQEVQIAIYYNESTLLIDKDYWDMLDELNKLALTTHEYFYLKMRTESGHKNSIHARKFVAHLFSNEGLSNLFETKKMSPESPTVSCTGYPDGDLESTDYLILTAYEVIEKDFRGSELVLHRFLKNVPNFRHSVRVDNVFLDFYENPQQTWNPGYKDLMLVDKDTYEVSGLSLEVEVPEAEVPEKDEVSFKFSIQFYQTKMGKPLTRYQVACNPPHNNKFNSIEKRGSPVKKEFLDQLNTKEKFYRKDNPQNTLWFKNKNEFVTINSYGIQGENNENCTLQMTATIQHLIRRDPELQQSYMSGFVHEMFYKVTEYKQVNIIQDNDRAQKLCENTLQIYRQDDLDEMQSTLIDTISPNEIKINFNGPITFENKNAIQARERKMAQARIDQSLLSFFSADLFVKDDKLGSLVINNQKIKITDKEHLGYIGSEPDLCPVARIGNVIELKERTAEERQNYIDYITHHLLYTTEKYELGQSSSPVSTECLQRIKMLNQKVDKKSHFIFYFELIDKNSFRTHFSGGGNYVKGQKKGPTLLDEVYRRQSKK